RQWYCHCFPTRRSSDLRVQIDHELKVDLRCERCELRQMLGASVHRGARPAWVACNRDALALLCRLLRRIAASSAREAYQSSLEVDRKSTRLNSSHVKIS